MRLRANQATNCLAKRERSKGQVVVLVAVSLRVFLAPQLGLFDFERQACGDHRLPERCERQLVDPDHTQATRLGDVNPLPQAASSHEHSSYLLERFDSALVAFDACRDQWVRLAALDP